MTAAAAAAGSDRRLTKKEEEEEEGYDPSHISSSSSPWPLTCPGPAKTEKNPPEKKRKQPVEPLAMTCTWRLRKLQQEPERREAREEGKSRYITLNDRINLAFSLSSRVGPFLFPAGRNWRPEKKESVTFSPAEENMRRE